MNPSERSLVSAPQAPWRIGVDVGGTFTDMVLRDAAGRFFVFKVPTVPEDPAQGVHDDLKLAAEAFDLGLGRLLGGCELFVHGSTMATNTIIERKGARVGLLTSQGFRDSLEIRRGMREDQWDHRRPFPEVLVPRYLRLPVGGRLDRDGAELRPLIEADVGDAVAVFAEEGVDAIAVSLINSCLDASHERRCGELLEGAWAGDWVSLSHQIVPVMGEYERTSTTVMNAYLAPRVVGYLRRLNERLLDLGLGHPILLVQSNGGAVSVDQVAARPVNLVLSGPAAGVGALNHYTHTAGSKNLICMEIGGTSCDVTLMGEGSIAVTDQLRIEGYDLATPAIDIQTAGAGGGTIAGVDGAGMLTVGPQGAGARPGPACYGFGGDRPTVTDAQLLLGRLRSGNYAGGAVSLNEDLARQAMETVAEPLGIGVEEAAIGVIRLLEQNLLHVVEKISIERGHNPARFVLVAAGGAGPMHGAAVARALGCKRLYVPRQAGAFCAFGMLHSDVRHDHLQVLMDDLDAVTGERLEAVYGDLESAAVPVLESESFGPENRHLQRQLDLRYRSQQWSIRVDVDMAAGFDPQAVRRAFEVEHERQFGHIQPEGGIDITALRLVARGLIELSQPEALAPAGALPDPESRMVYQDSQTGWSETPVYNGSNLGPGHRLTGPLLIEEPTTTVLAGPGDSLGVDEFGNLAIDVGAIDLGAGS